MGALVPAHPSSHDDDEGTILLFCFARRLRRSASVVASQSGTLLRNQPSACLRLRSIGRSILFFTAMSVGLRYPYLLSSIPGGTKLLSLFAPLFVYFKWNSGSFIATEEDEVLRPSTADYECAVGSPYVRAHTHASTHASTSARTHAQQHTHDIPNVT